MLNDNTISRQLWTVSFNFRQALTGDLPEKLSDALEDIAVSVFLYNKEATDGDDWTITLTTMGRPDIDDVFHRIQRVSTGLLDQKDILAEKLPEKDWLRHVHDNFPPIKIGVFFIHGSYYKGILPKGFVPLQIDAATAFGSGEHETTRGCLQALESLKKNNVFKNGLDMGCGSGILAIALAKLWPDIKVTAIDIDPEAIVVTRRHAQMNDVGDKIHAEAGDGYRVPLIGQCAPYDIVVANILADPLMDMAPDMAAVLRPGGIAVLSGLLKRQKNNVADAHEKQGLQLTHTEEIGDWQTFIFQKQIWRQRG